MQTRPDFFRSVVDSTIAICAASVNEQKICIPEQIMEFVNHNFMNVIMVATFRFIQVCLLRFFVQLHSTSILLLSVNQVYVVATSADKQEF
jgi:hypothetical protein